MTTKITDARIAELIIAQTKIAAALQSMGARTGAFECARDVTMLLRELLERRAAANSDGGVVFIATSLPTLQEMRIPVVTMAFGPAVPIPTDPALRSALAENIGQRAMDTAEKLRKLCHDEPVTAPIPKNLS